MTFNVTETLQIIYISMSYTEAPSLSRLDEIGFEIKVLATPPSRPLDIGVTVHIDQSVHLCVGNR